MRFAGALIAFALLAGMAPAWAKDPPIAEEAYRAVNLALVETHIRPRYARFAATGATLEDQVESVCATSAPRELELVRAAFDSAFGAWMGIAYIQEGPAAQFMRQVRLHFWPDKRGRTGKQLNAFLAADDTRSLAPERFSNISVALQGFGVAERLLFEHAHFERIASVPEDIRCQLLRSVARNIAQIGSGLVQDWVPGEGSFSDEFQRAGHSDSRFATHREATAVLVNGLFTSLKIVTDFKLDRVLGKTIEGARPKRAESWRSGRSLWNIIDNLTALQALYEGEAGAPGLRALFARRHHELASLLSTAFTKTLANARRIPVPLSQAVADPTARPPLSLLARQTRALKAMVAKELAPALGTPLGFNALDGD